MDTINQSHHIGRCIYCGAEPTEDDPLTDEHILPYGIFGKIQLLKGSCKECARKTSAFEDKVMSKDLGAVRTVLNFPSRHKKTKPDLLPVEVTKRDGEIIEVLVSRTDYPRVIVMPIFPTPAYIDEREYTGGIEMIGYSGAEAKQSFEALGCRTRCRRGSNLYPAMGQGMGIDVCKNSLRIYSQGFWLG